MDSLESSLQSVVVVGGQASALAYLVITILQVRQYGLRAWWTLGMGMGNRVDKLDEDLRRERHNRRKRKRVTTT